MLNFPLKGRKRMKKNDMPRSLVAFITEDIEEKILEGKLKPGQRMIEAELCKSYGVSQTPLREALRILESRGYVTHEPRKGAFVTKITTDDILETYHIRATLESLATYLAVKRKSPEVIDQLTKMHLQMIEVAAREDVKTYVALNFKFHETIINASQSKRLIQMLQTFVKQTERFRLGILTNPEMFNSSIDAHEKIIRGFESGDAEEAERLRKKSILTNVGTYMQKMKDHIEIISN
jgi:DNA-binding GntR family transcriptional regulator